VRYYERIGLITPERLGNGYRDYTQEQLRSVLEIKELAAAGIPPSRVAPFLDCLHAGHTNSDDCPSSLATYRDSIAELDEAIAALGARRAILAQRLEEGAGCTFPAAPLEVSLQLPENLPVPEDDGAPGMIPGTRLRWFSVCGCRSRCSPTRILPWPQHWGCPPLKRLAENNR